MSKLGAQHGQEAAARTDDSESNTLCQVRLQRLLARESSKHIQTGEPLKIDVSILYFTGAPGFSDRTCCIAMASTHRPILVRFRQQHSLKLRHQFRKILVPFGIGSLGITEQHDSYPFVRKIVN